LGIIGARRSDVLALFDIVNSKVHAASGTGAELVRHNSSPRRRRRLRSGAASALPVPKNRAEIGK